MSVKYNMPVKYNMQPSVWPVCRDLVMTYHPMMTSLSINGNMPPPDWSSIQERKGGGRQAVTERSEKKKKEKKLKNKIKIKAKQIQKREKIDKEIKKRKIEKKIKKKQN